MAWRRLHLCGPLCLSDEIFPDGLDEGAHIDGRETYEVAQDSDSEVINAAVTRAYFMAGELKLQNLREARGLQAQVPGGFPRGVVLPWVDTLGHDGEQYEECRRQLVHHGLNNCGGDRGGQGLVVDQGCTGEVAMLGGAGHGGADHL